MAEPTDVNPSENGRPEYSEDQYMSWLLDMAEFLKQGSSLWYAMDKAGLLGHSNSIYRKYRLNDWFCQKVDRYRSYVGELVNMIGFRTIERINKRLIDSDHSLGILTSEEIQVWKTMAEKHRSSQPFFVTRLETAESDPNKLGKVLDTLEATDYDDIGQQAQKQMVAAHAPVQDQKQAGGAESIPSQPDAAPAPSGSGQPQV